MNTTLSPSKKSFVEEWLLMPKALFFTLTLALYSTNSVLTYILADSWKFKASSTGFVYSLQIVNFFGAMYWSSLADRTGRHRAIITMTAIISTVFYAALMLPTIMGWKFDGFAGKYLFPTIMMTFMWIFQSALFPLTDSAILLKLSKDTSIGKEQFGYQRLFGSFGHLAGTFIASIASDRKNSKEIIQIAVSAVCAGIFCIFVNLGIPTISEGTLKKHAHHGGDKPDTKVDIGEVKEDHRSPYVRLLTNVGFLFFILFTLSAGLLANTLTIFAPLFSKALGNSNTKTATLKIPAVASEVLVWLTSKHLMSIFGKYWLLMFSQFAGLARIFGYQFITKDRAWPLYFLEFLKGVNSGCIVSAAVQIAAELAPPGCASTAQGAFSGVYKGIGYMVTGIFCGVALLLTNNQFYSLFLIVGCVSSVFTLIFFLKFLLFDRSIGFPCYPARPRPQ